MKAETVPPDGRPPPWRSLGLVTGSTVASAVITLGVTLVAVALLEQVEYGHFIFFVGVTTLVGTLCDLGVSARMIIEYDGVSKVWRGSSLAPFWWAQIWSYGLGATAIAAIGAVPQVADYFHVPSIVIVAGAANGALVGLFNFVSAMLQATQDWRGRSKVVVIQAVIRGAATLLGLGFGTAAAGAGGAVVGAGLGLVVGLSSSSLTPYRTELRRALGIATASRVWMQTRWFAITGIISAVAFYLPIAFVSRAGGAEALAIYGLAAQLVAGPSLLLNSVATFLLPSASDPGVPLGEYWRLLGRSVMPVFGLFVLAAIAAPPAISWAFGSDYGGTVVPFELLLASAAVFLIGNPVQFLHYRFDGIRSIAFMEAVLLVSLLVGFVLLIEPFSVPVAAAAAVLVGACSSRALGSVLLTRNNFRVAGADSGSS